MLTGEMSVTTRTPIEARRHQPGGLRIKDTSQAPNQSPAPTCLTVATIDDLRATLGLARVGLILETDLDVIETECDLHQRRRRDAEVLTTLAANCVGDALELGTSHGRGTFKLATNLPHGIVHTVNVLPEQAAGAGTLVTHLLERDAIGAFYRARGITNVRQIYANLHTWQPPAALCDLGMAFVDACHDEAAVWQDSHLAWHRLAPGGFLAWHDWSPSARTRFDWIDAVMRGASRFLADVGVTGKVVHLRDSWIGVLRKPT